MRQLKFMTAKVVRSEAAKTSLKKICSVQKKFTENIYEDCASRLHNDIIKPLQGEVLCVYARSLPDIKV